MYYPVNYGYVEGIMSSDGEEQWIVVPEYVSFTKDEIREQIHFQEQYFDSEILM